MVEHKLKWGQWFVWTELSWGAYQWHIKEPQRILSRSAGLLHETRRRQGRQCTDGEWSRRPQISSSLFEEEKWSRWSIRLPELTVQQCSLFQFSANEESVTTETIDSHENRNLEVPYSATYYLQNRLGWEDTSSASLPLTPHTNKVRNPCKVASAIIILPSHIWYLTEFSNWIPTTRNIDIPLNIGSKSRTKQASASDPQRVPILITLNCHLSKKLQGPSFI